jgi:hypothetical protein
MSVRPVLFVVCFTVGVTLMVFSGYVPRTASARTDPTSGFGTPPAASPNAVVSRPANLEHAQSSGTTRKSAAEHPAPAAGPAQSADVSGEDQRSPDASPAAADAAEAEEIRQNVATALAGLDEPAVDAADTSAAPAPEPAANAGADRVTWSGWDDIVLDGSRSTGDGLSYSWRQLSGPRELKIKRPNRAVARASGLPLGPDMSWSPALYEFELTVTDKHGRQSTGTMGYVVLAGPELTVRPPAQRRFQLRDSYLLGHYESWATAPEGGVATFKVTSPTGLTFTKIAGGPADITGGRARKHYEYEIVVHQEPGVAQAWLEFLVDTDEKIPGVLQLGVSWEGR